MDYTNMTLDEKIKLINEENALTKSRLIFNIVEKSNESDALKIIDMYADKINRREYDSLAQRFSVSKYFHKIIDIISGNLSNDDLCDYISHIRDYNLRIEYFFKYIDRYDFDIFCRYYDTLIFFPIDQNNPQQVEVNYAFIEELFKSSADVNIKIGAIDYVDVDKKKEYIDRFISFINSEQLATLIAGVKNYDKKMELYEFYKDKINNEDILLMVTIGPSTISRENLYDFLRRFNGVIPDDTNTYEKVLYKNFVGQELFDLVDEFMDKLDQQSLCNLIRRNLQYSLIYRHAVTKDIKGIYVGRNIYDINFLVNNLVRYSEYLDIYDIGKLVSCINDVETRIYNFLETIYKLNPSFKNLITSLNKEKYDGFINNIYEMQYDTLSNLFPLFADSENKIDSEEKIDFVITFVHKVMTSNSSQIRRISNEVLREILKLPFDKWDDAFEKVEEIFLKNNIPDVGKIYEIFSILHDDSKKYSMFARSNNLKKFKSSKAIDIVLFSDVLKCAISSNNRSLKKYLLDIKNGNSILKNIIENDIDLESLDADQKEVFKSYLNHLNSLYNLTLEGKKNPRVMTNDLSRDALELLQLFLKTEKDFDVDKLPDRIVSMFTHFIGINSIDDLINCMNVEFELATKKNIDRANKNDFKIEKGDYVKGLAGQHGKTKELYLTYLSNILQNGNLCQEFLGSSSSRDMTPLDADVIRVTDSTNSYLMFESSSSYVKNFGPIWVILKDDGKFINSDENNMYLPGKLEVFKTGVVGEEHYGIRTGFPSSAIDYFVVADYVKVNVLKYEIVMNGFYIPIVNTKGDLIFTPDEYFRLSENMRGLSYYGTQDDYVFAPELDTFNLDSTIIDVDKSIEEVSKKRIQILNMLKNGNINVILGRGNDLSEKSFELIDTGSTGRGTNKMNDYDFDFIMRVDRSVFTDKFEMQKLYNDIKKVFPGVEFENGNKIRDYEVKLPDGTTAKIDITFISKTDKLDYSTDECIKDRLANIKRLDSDKYVKVLQNIVLAKEVLKDCYKPKHAGKGKAQGGLGGVGVENWILQSGGSFERAARIFLSYAEGRSFEEFQKVYTVWDFGENHMADMNSGYKHDEFVSNNMDQQGYDKMKEVLKEYIRKLDEERTNEYSDEAR